MICRPFKEDEDLDSDNLMCEGLDASAQMGEKSGYGMTDNLITKSLASDY